MRRALVLVLLLLLLGAHTGLVYADCETPQPTATPEPTYSGNVLATQPGHLIGYWRLNETAGTTAADSSGNGRDGTYSGVTLNAIPFLNGDPAPSFDGVNDFVNIYSSSLASAFNGAEGTAMFWMKVDAGFWTDNALRRQFNLGVDAGNLIRIEKLNDNTLRLRYAAGGIAENFVRTTTTINWTVFALTWSVSGNSAEAYQDGTSYQTNGTLGTWSGVLTASNSIIGASSTSGNDPHVNYISNVAIWDVALSDSEVAALATVPTTGATQTPQPTCTPSPTPTHSPTPTFTPSMTANLRDYFTVIPPGTDPSESRIAALSYEVTAGQIMIAGLLWVLVVFMVIRFIRQLRRKG